MREEFYWNKICLHQIKVFIDRKRVFIVFDVSYIYSNVNAYAWDNIWEDGNGKRSAQLADEGYKVSLLL